LLRRCAAGSQQPASSEDCETADGGDETVAVVIHDVLSGDFL
jgi:hypothetical protein